MKFLQKQEILRFSKSITDGILVHIYCPQAQAKEWNDKISVMFMPIEFDISRYLLYNDLAIDN